jgi:signal transduction histidine kinase
MGGQLRWPAPWRRGENVPALDAPGSKEKSFLGLGLSICRRSVEANDGVLSVRNRPGYGCVFTIELPRRAAA